MLDLNIQMNTVKRPFAIRLKSINFHILLRACVSGFYTGLCLLMSAVCEFEQIIKKSNLPACEWK